MWKIFENLPIKVKLILSALGSGLLTLIVASIGIGSISSLGDTVNSSQGFATALSGMNNVSRNKAEYLSTPSTRTVKAVKTATAVVRTELVGQSDVHSEITDILNEVDTFSASFSSLVAATNNISQQSDKMSIAVKLLRKKGNEIRQKASMAAKSTMAKRDGQREIVTRALGLAAIVSETALYAGKTAKILEPVLMLGKTSNLTKEDKVIFSELESRAKKLSEASVSPKTDEFSRALSERVTLVFKLLEELKNDSDPMSRSSIQLQAWGALSKVEGDAANLRDAFINFNKQVGVSTKKLNRELRTALTRATIGDAFANAAVDVAVAVADYRLKSGKDQQKAVEDKINQLSGLAGAVKAMTKTDTMPLIMEFKKTYENLVKANAGLIIALASAQNAEQTTAKLVAELVEEQTGTATSTATQAFTLILAATIAAILFAVLITIGLWILISRPLSNLTNVTQRVSSGDLDIELDAGGRSDEVGQLMKEISVFRDNSLRQRDMEAEAEKSRTSERERQGRIEALIGDFRTDVQSGLSSVGDNATQMQDSAEGMTGIADQTSEQATDAETAFKEASGNVQTVASAAEELTSSIQEIRRQVSTTSEIVGQATQNASHANGRISELAAAADKIGDVVNLIQDIAEQTNLLALNATIEAARAGDAGKGFAVVASEVKSLATQTASATQEIASQIADIQGSTTDAVDAIGEITKIMDEVNEYTSTIAVAVDQQGSATSEISLSVQAAANSTQQAAEKMADVMNGISETTSSSNQVLTASAEVSDQAAQLRKMIDRFLKEALAA